MSLQLLAPVLILVGIGLITSRTRPSSSPAAEAKYLSFVAVTVGLTVLLVMLSAAGGLVATTDLGRRVGAWCPAVPLSHDVGRAAGSVSIVLLMYGTLKLARLTARRRRMVSATRGRRFALQRSPIPAAFVIPGKPGCVVVSTGLLEHVTPEQRQVVLAHERAHIKQRHHRYLLAGELAASYVPILRPLANRIRLATELSADQAALRSVHGDRELVVETITTVAALVRPAGAALSSYGGGSIEARLAALAPSTAPRNTRFLRAVVFAVSAAVALVAIAQIHHLAVVACLLYTSPSPRDPE